MSSPIGHADAPDTGSSGTTIADGVSGRVPYLLHRPLALLVGFTLVRGGTGDSRLTLGCRLVERLATTLPDRRIEVVADSAYAGRTLRSLTCSPKSAA